MTQNKKIEENNYIDNFLKTPLGEKWCQKYNFQNRIESEHPDFIFITQDNRKIGLEVTNFIIKSKHGIALQSLKTTGNKICKHVHKNYGFYISMIIDKFDKRKHCARTREEFLESVYDPGFIDRFNEKEIKSKIYPIIDKKIEKLKNFPCFIKESIEINNEYLTFSISRFPDIDGNFYCHVNNQSFSLENPFKELQKEIDKKNAKLDNYLKNCDECFLLIYNPDVSKGNYCHFTDKLNKQKFSYKFINVFFYDKHNKISIVLKNNNFLCKLFKLLKQHLMGRNKIE